MKSKSISTGEPNREIRARKLWLHRALKQPFLVENHSHELALQAILTTAIPVL